MIQLKCIDANLIDEEWPSVKTYIAKALSYSDNKYSLSSIKKSLKDRSSQLFIVRDYDKIYAACITSIIKYPRKKVLQISFAGGKDSHLWLHLISDLHFYALLEKCHAVEIYGRKGWLKKLSPYGYEHIHSVYRLPLEDILHEENMDENRIRV